MDIDYFKTINDRFGHLIGSKVLVEVGQILIKGLRTIDIVSRYGGDEFVVVLPQTSKPQAYSAALRLRSAINREIFFAEEGFNIRITASFGVATFGEEAESKDDLLRAVDEAMYQVKATSKDAIALAGTAESTL